MQGTEGEFPFLGVRGPEDPGATPCVDPVAEAPPGRVCGRVLVLELVQVLEADGVRDEALDLVEVRLRGGLEVDEALFVVPVPQAVVAELPDPVLPIGRFRANRPIQWRIGQFSVRMGQYIGRFAPELAGSY